MQKLRPWEVDVLTYPNGAHMTFGASFGDSYFHPYYIHPYHFSAKILTPPAPFQFTHPHGPYP
jgi:hypothetical protein